MLDRIRRALNRWLPDSELSDQVRTLQHKVAELTPKAVQDFAAIGVQATPGQSQEPAQWIIDRNEYVKHYKGPVYVGISAIAERVAEQEPKVGYRTSKKSGVKIELVPDNHPLNELFRHVNDFHQPWDLWFYTIAWKILLGESFWWKARNRLGKPVEIWPLPSQWVYPIPSAKEFIWGYRVVGVFGKEQDIPASEIQAIREPNLDWSGAGRFQGSSQIAACPEMVDNIESIIKRQWHTFKNFAPPGLHFATDRDLTEPQLKMAYRDIRSMFSSANQAGNPIVTHGGFQAKPFYPSIKEMDYPASLDLAFDYVLAVLGVPKAVVGLSVDYNRASAEAALATFAENTVNPQLIHLGQHLTQGIARDFDKRLVVYFDPITFTDPANVRADMELAARFNALTPNEIREIVMDRQRYKHGGDSPLIGVGMVEGPLGNASQPVEEEPEEMSEDDDEEPTPKRLKTKLLSPRIAKQVQYWMRLQDAREKRFAEVMSKFLRRQRGDVLKRFDELAGGKSNPPIGGIRNGNGLHAVLEKITARDVTRLLPRGEPDRKLRVVANEQIGRAMARGAKLELDSVPSGKIAGRSAKTLENTANIEDENQRHFVAGFVNQKDRPIYGVELPDNIANAIVEIIDDTFDLEYWSEVNDTTREALGNVITQGNLEGWTIPEIRDAIEELGEFSESRATTIARSESTTALNGGQYEVRKELLDDGTISGQSWLSTIDDLTRDTHVTADGQKIGPKELFHVGGYECRYPGDPVLPPEERVNCRCTSVSEID